MAKRKGKPKQKASAPLVRPRRLHPNEGVGLGRDRRPVVEHVVMEPPQVVDEELVDAMADLIIARLLKRGGNAK